MWEPPEEVVYIQLIKRRFWWSARITGVGPVYIQGGPTFRSFSREDAVEKITWYAHHAYPFRPLVFHEALPT